MILSIVAFTLLAYTLLGLAKFLLKVHRIPGPWGHLSIQFLGIVFKFAGKSEAQRMKILVHYAEKYPKVGKVIFGHMFIIFLHDPNLIQKIYSSPICLEKPFFYKVTINF